MTQAEEFVAIGEAARRLGVSVETVRRWESEHKITVAHRTPDGQRRFARSEIDRILSGGTGKVSA